MNKEILELYTDYEIASYSKITATGLSEILENSISHDKITRFLSEKINPSKELWQLVKPIVREIQKDDGYLIFDDTIQEKEYSQENEVISWHYDHTKGTTVKGVNILSCIYYVPDITIPVAIEVITKKLKEDTKTHEIKKKSEKTKNELLLEMTNTCITNRIKFKYILADNWYSSKNTMKEIKEVKHKEFVMSIKSNRLVCKSLESKTLGKFQRIDSLEMPDDSTCIVYLKGLEFPIMLARQIFKNKDKSTGEIYLVSSDVTLNFKDITEIYKKRWKVEEYHKSIKSNCGLAQSLAHTEITQINHFFTSIYAFVKLEKMKIMTHINHFALKTKIYITSLKKAFQEIAELKKMLAL